MCQHLRNVSANLPSFLSVHKIPFFTNYRCTYYVYMEFFAIRMYILHKHTYMDAYIITHTHVNIYMCMYVYTLSVYLHPHTYMNVCILCILLYT